MNPPKYTYHPEIYGLYSVELDNFKDARGMNFEIVDYQSDYYIKFDDYRLDSCSISQKNVLRGCHYDDINNKYIQILFGKVQLFVIDLRKDSPTFNNSKEFILDYQTPTQVFIPKNCANGHLVLSDFCVFYYKWSAGYTKQKTIKWNDPKFNLQWKYEYPILSDKDK